MKIQVINYSQGHLNINNDLWHKDQNWHSANVALKPQMRYADSSDYIGIQMDIEITVKESPAVTMGFLIGLKVEGWSNLIQEGANPEKDRSILKDICIKFWDVATGVIASSTTTPTKSGLILPSLDVEAFAKEITLIRS